MSSSLIVPSSHSRASRKQEIPANLISNWQTSAVQGVKPLVRRPKTACERCRTAKVKCPGDGEHECDRCASRGLFCRYTQPVQSPSHASSQPRPEPNRAAQEDVQMEFAVDPVSHFGGNGTFQQLRGSSVGWPNMNDIHPSEGLEQHIDWGAVDPSLEWMSDSSPPADRDLTGVLSSASGASSNTSATTADVVPTNEERRSLSKLGLFPFVTSTTAGDLSWQSQLTSSVCYCRSGLAMLIPSARAAVQEQRLDRVCQVTCDLIRQCQDIVSCNNCQSNCTDLICTVAVFQEADCCFDYIAKGDINMSIHVGLGLYKTAADEQDVKEWRRMLLMQLLRRANELLNSVSARGQEMLKELDPACRLGRVNIDYLEAVIRNSRENFNHITKGFLDETRSGG